MKQRKQNLIIAILLILLLWSVTLNFLQEKQIERLMNEVKDVEQIQSVLSSQIDELGHLEDLKDGE